MPGVTGVDRRHHQRSRQADLSSPGGVIRAGVRLRRPDVEQKSIDTVSRPERRRLFADLVASGRFCRDTPAGGILHRGSVSLREVSDGDSLHVCIDGDDRVTVHVDHFSPVAGANPDGTCRYTVGAVVTHLAAHVRDQVQRAVRGVRGQHRCRLECELVDVPEDQASEAVEAALDAPRAPDCSDRAGTSLASG